MRPLLAMALVVLYSGYADAQLFRYRATKQVSSSCPGGVCPTNVSQSYSIANTTAGHWSYPGTIDSHLESTHGVSTAGMSRQEKLNLHDSLHEGSAVVSVPRANYVQPMVSNYSYPVVVSGGGSTGSVKSGGSTGSIVSSTAEASVTARRSEFRKTLLTAARKARDSGEISQLQYGRLVVATLRPRELANIEAWAHEYAIQDGLATAQAPDWNAIIEFIEKLIPLIIQLIDLFS
jgi:hypothetical protein